MVGQGGGMTAAYHVGVTQALYDKYKSELSMLHRVVASSGAAAVYSYLVSDQPELQQKIFEYLMESKKFVVPHLRPPGKHMMDIDFMIDNVIKKRYKLDVKKLMRSNIDLDIGVTDASSGKSKFLKKNDPFAEDFYEVLRASCAVPYFGRESVRLGNKSIGFRQYLDGTIGSVSGLEEVAGQRHIMLVLTRPLDAPMPKKTRMRRVAAWLIMRHEPIHLQQAIWGMLNQVSSLPKQIKVLQKNSNLVIISPKKEIDMWRIEVRSDGLERLRRTIRQGYLDTISNPDLDTFFRKVREDKI